MQEYLMGKAETKRQGRQTRAYKKRSRIINGHGPADSDACLPKPWLLSEKCAVGKKPGFSR
jgi:hypothetical protein